MPNYRDETQGNGLETESFESSISLCERLPTGDYNAAKLPIDTRELGTLFSGDMLWKKLDNIGMEHVQALLVGTQRNHGCATYFSVNLNKCHLKKNKLNLSSRIDDDYSVFTCHTTFPTQDNLHRIALEQIETVFVTSGQTYLRGRIADASMRTAALLQSPMSDWDYKVNARSSLADRESFRDLPESSREEMDRLVELLAAATNNRDRLECLQRMQSQLGFEETAISGKALSIPLLPLALTDDNEISINTDNSPEVGDPGMVEHVSEVIARVYIEVGKVVGDSKCGLKFEEYQDSVGEMLSQFRSKIENVQRCRIVGGYMVDSLTVSGAADAKALTALASEVDVDFGGGVQLRLFELARTTANDLKRSVG